jgi:hypothetical protein
MLNKFLQMISHMKMSKRTSLLFILNALDALLTIYWVRNGFASEGNQLMAGLLDMGNAPFLTVKIVIGALAAIVLTRWGSLKIAQYGLSVALAVYLGLMAIHFFTGLSAFGYVSETFLADLTHWSKSLLG